jgi:hypothetical protein
MKNEAKIASALRELAGCFDEEPPHYVPDLFRYMSALELFDNVDIHEGLKDFPLDSHCGVLSYALIQNALRMVLDCSDTNLPAFLPDYIHTQICVWCFG